VHPPLLNSNRFSVLEVTEPNVDEDAQEFPETPVLPPTESRKLRWPKWKKRIKRKLVICSLELDQKCIMLPIHLKMTDTMEETSTEAMVDTSATGDFIDQDFVTQAKLPTRKLSQPIPVYNVDGTLNEARSIREVVNMIMTYDQHSEHILLVVTRLGKQSMNLGSTWLDKHNLCLNRQNDQVPPAQGGTEHKEGGHRTDKYLPDWPLPSLHRR